MLETFICALAIGSASFFQNGEYQAYGEYELEKALLTTKSADGVEQHSIDVKYVDRMIDDLARHSKNYPPVFKTKAERSRAERDVRQLAAMFDVIIEDESAEVELLLKAGIIQSFAHTLDVKGSAAKAKSYFDRLLLQKPDHPEGNYHYGSFLAGTADGQRKSLPYLEKAHKLGIEDALYGLGFAHLMLGEKTKALEYLEAYSEKRPKDEPAKTLIEAIKFGKIEFKRNAK